MKTLARFALNIGVAASLLAGCGGSQPSIGAPSAVARALRTVIRGAAGEIATASSFQVLHTFGNGNDGREPAAGLVYVNGALYGTTFYGGTNACPYRTCGTIFTTSTAGQERVLYSFTEVSGFYPSAGLVDLDGTFYGTTVTGGTYTDGNSPYGCGTVFSMSTTGSVKVLYNFGGDSGDGCNPAGGLTEINGRFYGMTKNGGAHGRGTVYSISIAGSENVLHSFGSRSDGAYPDRVSLIDMKGTLYGTTTYGGAYAGGHAGTVFSISTAGNEQVLHNFGNGNDGSEPEAGLAKVNDMLYGTTTRGGAYLKGTVFSVSTTGEEQVLHSFGNGNDGSLPAAAMIGVRGKLYGTTDEGGNAPRCGRAGCGTVFSITPTGSYHVLHNFRKVEGGNPMASLIAVKGILYGTTYDRGRYYSGTVFALRL